MPHTHGGTHNHMHPHVEGDVSHPAVQVEEKITPGDQVVLLKEPEPEKLIEIRHLSKNFRLDRHTVSRVLEDFFLWMSTEGKSWEWPVPPAAGNPPLPGVS